MTDSEEKKKRCPFKLKGYKTGMRGTRKHFRTKITIIRTHILCSTIYSDQDMETSKASISG